MKINKQIGNKGFTLVELMIVIVIIGVLAALASFGFIEYVKKSKSAEADEFVRKLGDGAKVYYTSEQKYGGDENGWHAAAGGNQAAGFPVPGAEKTFPGGAAQTVLWTSAAPPAGGGKIVPDLTGSPLVWKLLGNTSTDPAYFRYGYSATGAGTAATACIIAEANFDGDSAAATDCDSADGAVTNQLLKKTLSIVNGDVQTTPAVTYNQGK